MQFFAVLPVSPPFPSWLTSSFVCFGVCLFLCVGVGVCVGCVCVCVCVGVWVCVCVCVCVCVFFYFPNYFCCFVVFGLPLIYCFCNIGLCQALWPNGINK